MRQVGVVVRELVAAHLARAAGALKAGVGLQHGSRLVKALLQKRHRLGLLGQHSPGGHLADVGRCHVATGFEAILEPGQLHPLVVDGRHHLLQLFLGGHDDPDRRHRRAGQDAVLALLAEMLHHSPQVLDLIGAAGHVLAHLVNNEYHRVTGTAAGGQLKGAVHQKADGDVGLLLDGSCPRVRGVEGGGIQIVHHRTDPLDALGSLAHPLPYGVVLGRYVLQGRRDPSGWRDLVLLVRKQPGAGLNEGSQPALPLQLDLQIGHVVVLGIVQFAQHHGVQDLSHRLGGPTHRLVHLHVKHDDLGVESGVDVVYRFGNALHHRVAG